ncbi:hypothetical protein IF1G_02105 [Cordyceps javanica]|uniref:Uncharacterized protein n=1 Tax=Cordyceps javanica TaxID=43265 RepID=A0A545VDU0_9HYPO|nr:hypothetical protein IF1G_02105 [Cordyceps javanica]
MGEGRQRVDRGGSEEQFLLSVPRPAGKLWGPAVDEEDGLVCQGYLDLGWRAAEMGKRLVGMAWMDGEKRAGHNGERVDGPFAGWVLVLVLCCLGTTFTECLAKQGASGYNGTLLL